MKREREVLCVVGEGEREKKRGEDGRKKVTEGERKGPLGISRRTESLPARTGSRHRG